MYGNPIIRRFITTPAKGADQLVWLATTQPGSDWEPGAYFESKHKAMKVNPQTRSKEAAEALWDSSKDFAGL